MTTFNLEEPARELTEALAKAPPLTGMSLDDAGRAAEAAQSAPIPMPDIDEAWVTVPSNFGAVMRFNGTIHDFMRLNALRESESTRAAISLAAATLRRAFGTD